MRLLTIERNPETKQLEVVFSFNDNITISIPIVNQELTIRCIRSTAETLGLDADEFANQYKELYADLKTYTAYRKKVVEKIGVSNMIYNQMIQDIICGGILSMSEIYWFDWYVKKNNLIGGINNASN